MFLKNKNIIFKIRRSKVTDYAALIVMCLLVMLRKRKLVLLKRSCDCLRSVSLPRDAKCWVMFVVAPGHTNEILYCFLVNVFEHV